jgi:hypothetical protein
MSTYVGMDVHRKRSQVAVLDDTGVQQHNRNVPNDPAKLVPILGGLPPGTPVAFEAAYGWGWLVELLEELELEPHLVHPSRSQGDRLGPVAGTTRSMRPPWPLAPRGPVARGLDRPQQVGGRHRPERDQGQQIPLLDAVQPPVVEQPPGSGQPAAALGLLAPEQQEERQPEAAAGGPGGVAQAQPLAMRARPEIIALVILARQVRGGRQPLQILGPKPRLVVRSSELGVRVRPSLRGERLPSLIECPAHTPALSRRLYAFMMPPHQPRQHRSPEPAADWSTARRHRSGGCYYALCMP